ncbi:DUF1059 domain-containing protein [Nocardioides seonyuensis]|uniref:DUF1059 domain-containing protein n=1 Tax=Nocardioides seonyuensis TaxID=2518371 RepID=A0A4P7IGF5_9ACTN|nr:DUF1059 domain-containing protein [Nocardioides seonyuensis]QBX55733.1 DUF1059 domain-containing protein [Nocardioides seonyuensis]
MIEEAAMSSSGMVIECPCGVVLRGDDETDVMSQAQDHAKQTHDMDLSGDQARGMLRPA